VDFHVSRNELGFPTGFPDHDLSHQGHHVAGARAIQASGILESSIPRERIRGPHFPELRRGGGHLTDMIIREYVHESFPPSSVRSLTRIRERHRTGGEANA